MTKDQAERIAQETTAALKAPYDTRLVKRGTDADSWCVEIFNAADTRERIIRIHAATSHRGE